MKPQSLILIVDDQAPGRMALASLLEPDGYRLAFATNGAEAFTQMRLLAPDLVLLDVMMPEMDGFEVCRRIRADPALTLIPVIIVTALDDQAALLQGIEAGADDFVSKPFNRAELRARVRTITRLNRYRILLDEQRRSASERAQLLWAIERSADGYLILDAHDRVVDGNVQGWRYLGLAERPAHGLGELFLVAVRRHYQLAPEGVWAGWPEPSRAARYLVQPEGAGARWLQVGLLDLPRGGEGNRLVHLQDVTARISAQRDTWAFHSFVSHKLRTPMTSLLAGMGLFQRHTQKLPEDIAILAETAYSGAQRLKEVVDDIFRYLDTPIVVAHNEGAPLGDLPDLARQLGADLGIAAVQVAADLDHGEHRLPISGRTIALMLTELLENARKFHPRGVPTVQVRLMRRGQRAIISVTDDGCTITPIQLYRIWEPYQQIDDDLTGQVPGVGLGLATVAQICWTVGGTCRITNRPDGPGLTVDLDLPLTVGLPA